MRSLRTSNTRKPTLRSELAQVKAVLPESYYADRDLVFRVERMMEVWQKAITLATSTHELLDRHSVPKNSIPDVYDGLQSRLEAHFRSLTEREEYQKSFAEAMTEEIAGLHKEYQRQLSEREEGWQAADLELRKQIQVAHNVLRTEFGRFCELEDKKCAICLEVEALLKSRTEGKNGK